MRISDWSSDVCSSDLQRKRCGRFEALRATVRAGTSDIFSFDHDAWIGPEPRDAPSRFGSANVRRGGFERRRNDAGKFERSEEHTSELQSLMRISYAVFCLKKKKDYDTITYYKKRQ